MSQREIGLSAERSSATTWTEVAAHLDRALELDPQARAAWLAELRNSQPAVARSVAALLAEIEGLNESGFLLGRPWWHSAGLAPATVAGEVSQARYDSGLTPGATVGPYCLIREIGYGGTSSVWLAQRGDGQLKREVALKLAVLGPGMRLERFMRERDILAALTHPNIARLYDAGVSESGQPYLAMEYVAGTALTLYCDERRLTLRERLKLFVQVLNAVQFAHAELIIHRDLKPSNILVTPEGRVVLLDFGIGKLLTNDGLDATKLTQIGGRAFTPDYASPEQITGHALGTASDIYSLGVVLYELLAGNRPYRLARDSRAALEEAIVSSDVRRPSQSGISTEAAIARATSTRSLMRAMAGDLDTVVLKALKKNPLDRYASASAFAQDITNYLQSQPVSARADSKWYRVARFAVRHKAPVTAASFAVLALVGGAALAAWQARTASAERDRAVALASRNQAVSEFLGRVITEAAESQKPITVSEMLARSEKLALTDKSSSAENRAAVLGMIAQRYQSLDELDRAAQLFEKASQIVANSPDQALRSRLICDHAETVAAPENGAVQVLAISREIELLGDEPATAGHCLLALSRISLMDHRAEEGIRHASLGLARMREAGQEFGAIAAALLDELAFGYHLTGRNVDADKYFAQSLRQYSDLGQERSDGALVVVNDWGVAVLNAGVPRRAQQLFEQSLRIEQEREPGVEPGTTTVGNEALALLTLGRFDQARAAFERECRLAQQRKDDYSEAHCWMGFAALSTQMGSFGETPQYLSRATQLMGAAPADSPSMMQHAFLQGTVDLANGHLDAARAQFERAMARNSPSPRYLNAQLGMVEVRLAAGNAAAGLQLARSALQTAATLQGGLPYSQRTGLAWLTLGRAAQRAGDETQARKAFEAAVTHLSNTVDADHPGLLEARRSVKSPSSGPIVKRKSAIAAG